MLSWTLKRRPCRRAEARRSRPCQEVLEERTVPAILSVTAAPFNADPTGVTDATAAIQNCINAASSGDTVFFPNGTYKISFPTNPGTSPAIVLRSGVTLQGNGAANSVIRLADAQPNYDAIFGAATPSTPLSNVEIDDLGIDANSQNNVITSTSQLPDGAGRYVVRVYQGNNIDIQDDHIFDIQDDDAITLNGTNLSNVTVADNVFDHIGGAPVDFDHSTIYTDCNNATITGNTLASQDGAGTNGARTALDIHGNDQVVTNNSISGYRYGINVSGSSGVGSDTQLYQNNTLTDVGAGFSIWATPALSNVTIRDNSVEVNVDGWNGFFDGEGRAGIASSYGDDSPGQVNGLDIINNTITFTNYASTSRPNDWYINGIQLRGTASQGPYSNVQILDNHIDHALGAGIYLDQNMSNVDISGNIITDPGSSPQGAAIGNDNLSAIYLSSALRNTHIFDNIFIDDRTINAMQYGILAETNLNGDDTYGGNILEIASGAAVPEFAQGAGYVGPAWSYVR